MSSSAACMMTDSKRPRTARSLSRGGRCRDRKMGEFRKAEKSSISTRESVPAIAQHQRARCRIARCRMIIPALVSRHHSHDLTADLSSLITQHHPHPSLQTDPSLQSSRITQRRPHPSLQTDPSLQSSRITQRRPHPSLQTDPSLQTQASACISSELVEADGAVSPALGGTIMAAATSPAPAPPLSIHRTHRPTCDALPDWTYRRVHAAKG